MSIPNASSCAPERVHDICFGVSVPVGSDRLSVTQNNGLRITAAGRYSTIKKTVQNNGSRPGVGVIQTAGAAAPSIRVGICEETLQAAAGNPSNNPSNLLAMNSANDISHATTPFGKEAGGDTAGVGNLASIP